MTLVPANSRPVNPLANVTSVFARTGAVVAGNADYLAVPAGGLTGAVAATRFVGGTATVAPTTGTFAVGDFVVAQNGTVWVCTVAGSPGTWTQAGGGSQPLLTATVTLTAAQILDLTNTPVVVIPSAGANTQIVPMSGIMRYSFGATPYGGAAGAIAVGPLSIDVDPEYVEWFVTPDPILSFLAAEDRIATMTPDITTVTSAGHLSSCKVWADEDIVAYSLGDPLTDGDGTVTVVVFYYVIDLA